MLTLPLDLDPTLTVEDVRVQDEPALEIALPQVFDQPRLTTVRRGKMPYLGALVAKVFRAHQANPTGGLGTDYQALVNEFQPLMAWAEASWDFLLTTEGCRFIQRHSELKLGVRGDYRVVTYKDYSRLSHGVFRRCVLDFAREPQAVSLDAWLRGRFWAGVLHTYRALENPPDPRQRALTAYSYLRCVPYEFLNAFHQDRVADALEPLDDTERRAIGTYFLHFYTEPATAAWLGMPIEACRECLRQGLVRLLLHDRLVYCLLRQIERY